MRVPAGLCHAVAGSLLAIFMCAGLPANPAAYAAMEIKDSRNDMNFLVIGPWRHGGGNGDGSSLGAIKFDGDTGRWFRRTVLLPFLDSHLKDDGKKASIAPVTVFETGANQWRRYDRWPQSCAEGFPNRDSCQQSTRIFA